MNTAKVPTHSTYQTTDMPHLFPKRTRTKEKGQEKDKRHFKDIHTWFCYRHDLRITKHNFLQNKIFEIYIYLKDKN